MMISNTYARPVALCFMAFTLLTPLGCKSAGGEGPSGSAASISGPLTILPEYDARAPRTCSKVTSPPSAEQAAVMVQCTMEGLSPTGLQLFQDVKLEMGAPRAFIYNSDAGLAGIDTNAQVYPLRGSYTGYFCTKWGGSLVPIGHNCVVSAVPTAEGQCWKTSFGDWSCKMQGGAPQMTAGPGPKTF
ncbi:MAG: hypothetical protein ABSA85_06660 [Terracidiphilus sp.]|jgi:hypothetical protein